MDKSLGMDVIIHSLEWFNKYSKDKFDYILLLQPTSPLRDEKDIDNAITKIIKNNSNSLVSVGESPFPSDWVFNHREDQKYFNFNKKKLSLRSQQLQKSYFLNGAIFIAKFKFFLKIKVFILIKPLFIKCHIINQWI